VLRAADQTAGDGDQRWPAHAPLRFRLGAEFRGAVVDGQTERSDDRRCKAAPVKFESQFSVGPDGQQMGLLLKDFASQLVCYPRMKKRLCIPETNGLIFMTEIFMCLKQKNMYSYVVRKILYLLNESKER
jgi:hypothetical protein